MTPAFRIALALSTAGHIAFLVAVPFTPPVYDVEQAPASVELTLTRAPQSQPPVETPQTLTPVPLPEPLPVQAPEHRGAVAETQPGYVRNPPPIYPEWSRTHGEEGTVVLEVEVQASGRCGDVRVLHSSGSRRLDAAAVTAVRRWVFRPAKRWQLPVSFWVEIPITFELTRYK